MLVGFLLSHFVAYGKHSHCLWSFEVTECVRWNLTTHAYRSLCMHSYSRTSYSRRRVQGVDCPRVAFDQSRPLSTLPKAAPTNKKQEYFHTSVSTSMCKPYMGMTGATRHVPSRVQVSSSWLLILCTTAKRKKMEKRTRCLIWNVQHF